MTNDPMEAHYIGFNMWVNAVTRADRPEVIEPLHLTTAALGAGPGILDGARVFATLALVARGAADALDAADVSHPA